jgi:hypothetical protein
VHRKTRLPPVWRAALLLAAAQARTVRARVRGNRHVVVSALLVVAGMGGMLGGAALIGSWCLGLVLICESAWVTWLGLARDDGQRLPQRAPRTVGEALGLSRMSGVDRDDAA